MESAEIPHLSQATTIWLEETIRKAPEKRGRGAALDRVPPRPDSGASDGDRPLVSWSYGHNPFKQGLPEVSPEGAKLKVFPHGFRFVGDRMFMKIPERTKDRGTIEGFSEKAAGRLRQFVVENWGGESTSAYSYTFTSKALQSPEEWRSTVKRFRTYLSRETPLWAGMYRVELQKRKAPHLHSVFWVPDSVDPFKVQLTLKRLWLKATREKDDADSRKYSVKGNRIKGGKESGWLVYCTLHNGKKKESQLGWKGKQWGVWNRSAWIERSPEIDLEPTQEEMVRLCRVIRAWSRFRIPGSLSPPWRLHAGAKGFQRVIPSEIMRQLLRVVTDNRLLEKRSF